MERGLVIDSITQKFSSTKRWIKRNSRVILHLLFLLSFLFSISAIISHVFFFSSFPLLFVCMSILCLSCFTILSFKSSHTYYSHILIVLGFLFFISSTFVIIYGLAPILEPDVLKQYLDFTLFVSLLIIWLISFFSLSFKFFYPYYSHILLILSFLFPLAAIISFSSPPLLFVCMSIFCLSCFTVLSFKSCHPYYPSILFILSFLFYLFTIILIIFWLAINQVPLDFTLFGRSFHQEFSPFELIDLSFLTISQSILCLIIGMILKIKHNPPFFSFFKNKFFYLHFISASIVTVLLFYLMIQFMDKYTDHAEEFELKDFQSFTIDQVSGELEQLGLKYQILDSVFTDSVPKGTIFKQRPIPGTFVKKERTIYFTVNRSNSKKFKIPNVINQSKREAINQLGSHFKLEFEESENYSSNSVVSRLECGGKVLKVGDLVIKGSKIYVYFGSGRSSSNIIVPLLINSSTEEAKIILEQSNLKIGSIIAEGEILDTLNAIVINQIPLSESQLQTGDMVDIFIKQSIDNLQSTDSTTIE